MGICILKEFPEPSEECSQQINGFSEHKSAVLDYQNNETETNLNLSIAHEESFEKNLSGFVSHKLLSEHKCKLKIGLDPEFIIILPG